MSPDLVPLLAELIAADTRNPGGDEPALARRLAGHLGELGPDLLEVVEVPRPADRPGLGAYVVAAFGRPRVLVNAHLDTVPANTGWSGDPLRAEVRDDRVIGLGAADTKGAIAAVIAALRERRPRDLAVLFSGDEERGGSCMHAFLARRHLPALERVVVCEPTGCRVGVRHRGILALEARYQGAGGHSSGADRMPKPVVTLARLAVALDELATRAASEGPPGFPGLCVNVAALDGGVAFNVVPDAACLVFSVRPPPGADVPALRARLEALAAQVDPAIACRTLLDHRPFESAHAHAFRALLGPRVDAPIDLPYWTEAAVLAEAGLGAVVFGPGEVSQAHAPDEHVTLEDLAHARAAFGELIRATESSP